MALDSFDSQTLGTFQPKHIGIGVGINKLVAAEAGKRIKVFLFMLSGDTTVCYDLYSGTNPIFSFYGMEYFGTPLESHDRRVPLFLTNVGEDLRLVASAAVNGNCYIHYKVE